MDKKQYNKQYYAKNRDKILEQGKIYHSKNRDKRIASSKAWRQVNKKRFQELQRKNKIKKIKILQEISNSLKTKCSYCECNNPHCIDWHHIDKTDKKLVTRIITDGLSKERLLQEINKCIPVCANCHRKLHKTTGLAAQDKKGKYIYNIKSNSKCKHCNISESVCLVFHHRNPEEKTNTIHEMVRNKQYLISDIEKEIQKCDIVCFNCHRLIHSEYNSFKLAPLGSESFRDSTIGD